MAARPGNCATDADTDRLAALILRLVAEEVPVMTYKYGPGYVVYVIHPEWEPLLYGDFFGIEKRHAYCIDKKAVPALSRKNERGQPLIYLLLRSCESPELRSALLRLPVEILAARTSNDDSNALHGLFWGLWNKKITMKIGEFNSILNNEYLAELLDCKNWRGDTPRTFAELGKYLLQQ